MDLLQITGEAANAVVAILLLGAIALAICKAISGTNFED